MATPTYDLLDSVTLSSSASSVTFSSIDQSYRDLVLVSSGLKSSGTYAILRFNGDSSSIYQIAGFDGDGSTTSGFFQGSQPGVYSAAPYHSTTPNSFILQVLDYAQTDKNKSFFIRSGHPLYWTKFIGARYSTNSAITSITLDGDGYSFTSGSTWHLYGIAG